MANTIRVYKSEGEWKVKRDGASRAIGRFSTQKEAYLRAREVALNNGLTITVYYPNGGIKAVINPRNREEESNCFITTACVNYFALSDNCYELETLRRFRDQFLLQSSEGSLDVEVYYDIAPVIVNKLENDPIKNLLFERIFSQIRMACMAIDQGDNSKAHSIYRSSVKELKDRYGI